MKVEKISLSEKFAQFDDTWQPKIVAELNGFHVKLVKLEGEFVWHHHDFEDELFFLIDGALEMKYRDAAGVERSEHLAPGEFLVIPHGVEHCPVAAPGTQLMLIEPKSTLNTGTGRNERTSEAVWL